MMSFSWCGYSTSGCLTRASCAAASGSPGFFDGLDLFEPGIVHLPDWHPDEPVSRPLDISGLL